MTFLHNNPYQTVEIINKACVMTGKSQLELEQLNHPNKCSRSIFDCICKKCPSLNMCYDGLEVIE